MEKPTDDRRATPSQHKLQDPSALFARGPVLFSGVGAVVPGGRGKAHDSRTGRDAHHRIPGSIAAGISSTISGKNFPAARPQAAVIAANGIP